MTVPAYLPASVRPLLPWARRHVERVAARYSIGTDDLWDEVVTALLRVSLQVEPWARTKKDIGRPDLPTNYTKTAIHRACWRYVVRKAEKQPVMVALDEIELAFASAEEEVMAREAAYLFQPAAGARAAAGPVPSGSADTLAPVDPPARHRAVRASRRAGSG